VTGSTRPRICVAERLYKYPLSVSVSVKSLLDVCNLLLVFIFLICIHMSLVELVHLTAPLTDYCMLCCCRRWTTIARPIVGGLKLKRWCVAVFWLHPHVQAEVFSYPVPAAPITVGQSHAWCVDFSIDSCGNSCSWQFLFLCPGKLLVLENLNE
jgi:hypothetical protein